MPPSYRNSIEAPDYHCLFDVTAASSACKFRKITLTNIAHVTGLFSYSHLFYVFSCHVRAPFIGGHPSFSHIYNDDDIRHENVALYLFPNSQARKKLKNLGLIILYILNILDFMVLTRNLNI